MLKYLRIAVTALSLTACVLLVALWVRSYWWKDSIARVQSNEWIVFLYSDGGRLALARLYNQDSRPVTPWEFTTFRSKSRRVQRLPRFEALGFMWRWHAGGLSVRCPHWALLIPIAIAAILPWIKWRFSLRTLLIATTLVAVGLGVIMLLN